MSYDHCGSKSQLEVLDQEFDNSIAGIYDLLDQTLERANTSRVDYSTNDPRHFQIDTSQARRSPLAAFLESSADHDQIIHLEPELTPHFHSKQVANSHVREAEKMTRKLFEQVTCVSIDCSNASLQKGYLQDSVAQNKNKNASSHPISKNASIAKQLRSYSIESQLEGESSLHDEKLKKYATISSKEFAESEDLSAETEERKVSNVAAVDSQSNSSYKKEISQITVQSEAQNESNLKAQAESQGDIEIPPPKIINNKEKSLNQQPIQDKRSAIEKEKRRQYVRIEDDVEVGDSSMNCSLNRSRHEEKAVQTEHESPKSSHHNVPVLSGIIKTNPIPIISGTPPKQYTPLKKEKSTAQLFEENVNKYERDIDCMHKFVTQETIQKLENSPAKEKQVLFDSPSRPYKSPKCQTYNKMEESLVEDPVDRFVVARSPLKERELEQNLISVYQQVSEVYADGTKYVGEKFLGKRHGKGTYYYKEGHKYEGNWDQDQMSGYGTLWLTDDLKWYEGEWFNNSFNGRGVLNNLYSEPLEFGKFYGYDLSEVDNGWAKYEGVFNEGSKHGFGSLFLTNGDLYVGAFSNNIVDGRGSYTKSDQSVVAGRWENNKLMETY